jgi:sugar lactone lactonase YvrE
VALAAVALAAVLPACAGPQHTEAPTSATGVERVATFERMPSGVAVHGTRVFVAFPRWHDPGDATVYELEGGDLVPYPSAAHNDVAAGPEALHSVNGLHMDSRGWLWILDNARVDLGPAVVGAPKLVVWDTVSEREVFRHVFSSEIAPPAAAFLNDVVVDEAFGYAYLTQSGMGGPPSLVAFEIHRDRAERVLDGDASVQADPDRTFSVEGQAATVTRADGAVVPWRVAANGLVLAPDGQTLLFGATSSDVLHAVQTVALRNPDLPDAERAAHVRAHGRKPVSDGLCASPDGRIFATDIERSAVVELTGDAPQVVAQDPALVFPVACEASEDGWLWITGSELHLLPLLHGGRDDRSGRNGLFRVRYAGAAPSQP